MRSFVVAICCLLFAGCSCNCQNEPVQPYETQSYLTRTRTQTHTYYVPRVIEQDYQPAEGRVFHVAGFDVKEGQQMQDFFDDFEEPMHTHFSGDNVDWTYYVDYDRTKDKGKIVRYCDLKNYPPHSLCAVKVKFAYTYVSDAVTNCK